MRIDDALQQSVMNFKIEAFDLSMNFEALQLADSLPAAGAAGSGKVATDGAVLPGGVA
jgi:hypothetical protein